MREELPPGFFRIARRLTLAALVLFTLPLPYYGWSRMTGALPSESEWWSRAMNHGPWRWQLPAVLVLVPIYLLPIVSVVCVVVGATWSYEHQRPGPIAVSFIQAGACIGLLYAQLTLLYWTID